MFFKALIFLIAIGSGVGSALAHTVTDDMTSAATRFLAALSPEQKTQAKYEVEAPERLDWHYVPRKRGGLSLHEMTSVQRHLVTGMLGAVLSHRGILQAATIMSLEGVLADIEQGRGPTRDAELYYVSVFGEPEAAGAWGWRFEGHHLSLNFLVVEGRLVSVTPSFWGANPAEVRSGPRKGLRALSDEEDLGRSLMASLSAEQRQRAIIATNAPADIILSPNRKVELLTPAGLNVNELDQDQSAVLHALLEQYIRRYRTEVAEEELERIEMAGFDQVHFAWAGSLRPGEAYYYRVQGPTFVLEFDNAQDNANHIHSVWRDGGRDFGADVLSEHYRAHPH